MISIIVVIGKNREIGCDNKLLWDIPKDMERFTKIYSNIIKKASDVEDYTSNASVDYKEETSKDVKAFLVMAQEALSENNFVLLTKIEKYLINLARINSQLHQAKS